MLQQSKRLCNEKRLLASKIQKKRDLPQLFVFYSYTNDIKQDVLLDVYV